MMKIKYVIGIIGIIIPNLICGQSNGYVDLLFVDALGNRDSVQFGYDYSATTGIDIILGEKNIIGTPNKNLDVRLIQRDSIIVDQNCQSNLDKSCKAYFANNLDTKIDLRENYNQEQLFVLSVSAVNFPVSCILKKYTISSYIIFTKFFYNPPTGINYIGYQNWQSIDTLFKINDNSNNVMKFFRPDWLTSINQSTIFIDQVKLYPNPAITELKIEILEGEISDYTVFDLFGSVIYRGSTKEKNFILDVSNYSRGVYLFKSDKSLKLFTKI